MRHAGRSLCKRTGSSYLEVQVAMVLLSIGIGGLYSLSVVQTRQTTRLEQMLPADAVASINPVTGSTPQEAAWAKKLGVYVSIESDAVATPVPTYPLNHGYEVVIDNEDSSGFFTHQATGGDDWEEYGGHPGDNQSTVSEIETPAAYGSLAAFIFYDVPPGDYELFTYVPTKKSSYPGEFGSAVPHQIYNNGWLKTVNVDQRSLEHDLERSGRWWERLGALTLSGGTVYVVLRDTPKTGDYLVADAVMLRCRRSFEIVTPVTQVSGDAASITVEKN